MHNVDGFFILILALPVLMAAFLFLSFKFRDRLTLSGAVRLVLWNAGLSLFLVFSVLLVGETYYRFFVDTTDSFGLNKISKRWSEQHYQFNNAGARDNVDYEPELTPGKRRISFFGDSFTAGHGIPNVDDRFANRIRKTHPEWEVHVFAANGMETINETEELQNLDLQDYQFDVLVWVYCLNDISYLLPETREIYDRIFAFNDRLGFLGRNSYFINMLRFRQFAASDPDILHYYDFVKDGYFNEAWESQSRVLQELTLYTQKRGWKLLVVTFPFFQNRGEGYEFTEVHQRLNEFWQSMGVPHLDLLPVYVDYADAELVVNRFDAHPNEFAHSLAAEAIGRFLKKEIGEPATLPLTP